jgi:hypothetical protein
VQRKIFGPKREEMIEGWEKLYIVIIIYGKAY